MKLFFRLFLALTLFVTSAQAQVVFNNGGGAGTSVNLATFTNTRLGEFFFAYAGKTEAGLLAVNPGTIANGAIDYPLWAAQYPEFVSGNDIVFPPNVEGMFLRNLGGAAAVQGAFQTDATAVNGLSGTQIRYNSLPNNTSLGGSNARWRGTSNTPITLTASIDTNCEVLQLNAGTPIVTTNGVTINPGDWHINCQESGTLWAAPASGNYATSNLTSDAARSHAWNHNQLVVRQELMLKRTSLAVTTTETIQLVLTNQH